MKRINIGLLAAGIALVAGSCVPLVSLFPAGTSLPPAGGPYPVPGNGSLAMSLAGTAVVVPVIRVEPLTADPGDTDIEFTFSVTGQQGKVLSRQTGGAAFPASPRDASAPETAPLVLRLEPVEIPAGRWNARLKTVTGNQAAAGNARLTWRVPTPGFLSTIATALMLAIAGWLTATLGAMHWIRSHARPADTMKTSAAMGHDLPGRPWLVACHLSALLGYILPFGHLIGPSAIWISRRQAVPAVERVGREVLNFQLSVTLYALAGLFLSFFLIGFLVLFLLVVFHFSMVLYASLRAQRGLDTRYPLSLQII